MILTVHEESAWTEQQRRAMDAINVRLLGRLQDAPASEVDELEEEIGIPRPAWFSTQLPTVSDVAMTGQTLRRST